MLRKEKEKENEIYYQNDDENNHTTVWKTRSNTKYEIIEVKK